MTGAGPDPEIARRLESEGEAAAHPATLSERELRCEVLGFRAISPGTDLSGGVDAVTNLLRPGRRGNGATLVAVDASAARHEEAAFGREQGHHRAPRLQLYLTVMVDFVAVEAATDRQERGVGAHPHRLREAIPPSGPMPSVPPVLRGTGGRNPRLSHAGAACLLIQERVSKSGDAPWMW
jgi:hypothetical protein